MWKIVKTELWKLKRYSILWAGIALMLLSVLLTLFTSMAHDGSVWDFAYLTEQVIKNNMSMIFPMCITLIVGYIVSREQKDGTLKCILTVPISFRKLLVGKLIVGGMLSLAFGMICTIFTLIAEFVAGFPGFTVALAVQALLQITFVNLFLYFAVLPIIVITSHSQNGFLAGVIVAFVYGYVGMFAAGSKALYNIYPITASLGLIQYRSYEAQWNIPLCILSICLVLIVSTFLILVIGNSVELKKPTKKNTKTALKKGW